MDIPVITNDDVYEEIKAYYKEMGTLPNSRTILAQRLQTSISVISRCYKSLEEFGAIRLDRRGKVIKLMR